jgi:hypothetical protein
VNPQDQRKHQRLAHRAKIKVALPGAQGRTFFATLRDLSDSGLFLLCAEQDMPRIDESVEVQTTEFEGAPVRTAKVVRLENAIGFGVRFSDAD